jgi:uncharacterized repeat protein (TIGR03803 family)
MTKLRGWKTTSAALILCAATVGGSRAQTLTTLRRFDAFNGFQPLATVVQGLNGNLYGTTYHGGGGGTALYTGTVFEITPSDELTTLHSFCAQPGCADGTRPYAALAQATNGNFYGTTAYQGIGGGGTVFEITPAGKLTTLYSFCSRPNCADGSTPTAGLVQAVNGNLYGTTDEGGVDNGGTVFEITPAGRLTTLYSFCSQPSCADGSTPAATLVQASNGNLYGTTYGGGANQYGTVFEITPSAKLTTLYSFCSQPNCADGGIPWALVQASNGNLYGTTYAGGANAACENGVGCGTVFEITLGGQLTTLYSFCSQQNCTDGARPNAGPVLATDGNLYGTTLWGGADNAATCFFGVGCGTAFEITPGGQLTTLYSFCSQPKCADGASPYAGLTQATDGNLYGTTSYGGDANCYTVPVNGCGTVFRLSVGLGPFVETLPTGGKVGAKVGILGNNLTGATSVVFNGIPAQFTVKSSTLIVTHVPTGATTGTVQITLPGGMLTSNVPFHVIP